MEVEFEKDYLRELYEDGKTSSKKHRFQPDIVKRYQKAVNMLRAANKAEDLFAFNNLNYKKLTGTDIESVRVNDQYRIEFRTKTQISQENKIIVEITICSIIELSNHYK